MKTDNDDLSDTEEDWSEPLVEHNEIRPNITKSTSPRLSSNRSPSETTKCNVHQEHLRTIIHIDIDCFYAQVEMIKNPSLASQPLGIQQKYIIVTCNYPARKLGVTKLMTVKDAKAKCPSLIMVSGEDLTDYRKMSYKISEYLLKFTKHVERLGFDENYLDVSGLVDLRQKNKEMNSNRISGHVYGCVATDLVLGDIGNKKCTCGCYDRMTIGSQIAQEIREGLYNDIGITSCAGISHNKLLSKLIGGFHKPNQQTTLFANDAFEFVHSLSNARNIPGIGHALSKKLAGMGIVSVADLYNCPKQKLSEELGDEMAVSIQNLASGIDNTPVIKYSQPQSISDEDSFRNLKVFSEVEKNMKQLVTNVVKRVEEDGRLPQTLRITVRKFLPNMDYNDVSRESRQCPLPSSAFQHIGKDNSLVVAAIYELAMNLFKKLVDVTKSFNLSLINVCVTKFNKPSGKDISNYFQPKATVSGDDTDLDMTINSNARDGLTSPSSSKSSNDLTKECASKQPCSTIELPTGGIMDYFGNKRKSLPSHQSTTKRSKLDNDHSVNTQNVNGSDERTKKLVDMSVDLDVYNQLPEDIQREILQGQSQQHNASLKSPVIKGRNSIHSFFNSKAKSSKDVKEGTSTEQVSLSTSAVGDNLSLNENKNSIPPNIDKDVFTNLPSDIQQELVQQWKQNSNRSTNQSSAKTKPTSNLLNYFKKN